MFNSTIGNKFIIIYDLLSMVLMSLLLRISFVLWIHIFSFLPQIFIEAVSSEEVIFQLDRDYQFRHPYCMKAWQEKDVTIIREKVQKLFDPYRSIILNREGTQCKPSHQVVMTGTSENMPPWFNHFPHFASLYLRFFSYLLWQERIYSYHDNSYHSTRPCVTKFLVNSTLTSFWNVFLMPGKWAPAWIPEFVHHINRLYYTNTMTSETFMKKQAGGYVPIYLEKVRQPILLHPSDGLLLTASLLRISPCLLFNQSQQLLNQRLTIRILNRRGRDRSIINIDDVLQTLQTMPLQSVLPGIHRIEELYFEGKSLSEQANIMYQTDVFILIHGAGFTNILFMKPCSIIIEILPWLYHAWDFFKYFSEPLLLLKYPWMEDAEHTIRFPREKDTEECVEIMNHYRKLEKQSPYNSSLLQANYLNEKSLSSKCMHERCTLCSRRVNGVKVSLDKLKERLVRAIKDRQRCIKTHPFYNPTSVKS